MDIKCRKCECRFNNSCTCMATRIKVGFQVDCETYEYCEKNAENLNKTTNQNMFEFSSEIVSSTPKKNSKIYCDAKCLFNKSGLCHANGITVVEGSNSTNTPICATRIKE